eukprot:1539112-Pyramimonas_sp.AAC.1
MTPRKAPAAGWLSQDLSTASRGACLAGGAADDATCACCADSSSAAASAGSGSASTEAIVATGGSPACAVGNPVSPGVLVAGPTTPAMTAGLDQSTCGEPSGPDGDQVLQLDDE